MVEENEGQTNIAEMELKGFISVSSILSLGS
jgi:hypothetical protein